MLTIQCTFNSHACFFRKHFKGRAFPCSVCATHLPGTQPSRWASAVSMQASRKAAARADDERRQADLRADQACRRIKPIGL